MIACPECDTLHRWHPLAKGEHCRCVRCGAVLYRHPRLSVEQMLAFLTTALVVFLLANAYPIVILEVQGVSTSATLPESVLILWAEGRWLVATLVAATTILFPLTDLSLMLALFLALAAGRGGSGRFTLLFRIVRRLRPWGMIEVFMLGTGVALIKLTHLARVVPGVALFAFGVLTVLIVMVVSYDLRWLWVERESAR
ncbi:MAG: paraquat-inducible protein A [Telmatospirillum sp.]|nr:paraquat-inducible protein A [Telmatospirillum sp.]